MTTSTTAVVFDDLTAGSGFPPITQHVTQELIDATALATLDFNPVHTNREWASRAQVFGTPKTVAHGMFTMSLMVSVVNRPWLGSNAHIVQADAKFTRPVPVGSVVTATAEISELHPRGGGADDVIVISAKVTDQDDHTVAVAALTVHISPPT
jgi:acyl dehydratase